MKQTALVLVEWIVLLLVGLHVEMDVAIHAPLAQENVQVALELAVEGVQAVADVVEHAVTVVLHLALLVPMDATVIVQALAQEDAALLVQQTVLASAPALVNPYVRLIVIETWAMHHINKGI